MYQNSKYHIVGILRFCALVIILPFVSGLVRAKTDMWLRWLMTGKYVQKEFEHKKLTFIGTGYSKLISMIHP
jgi:hypothetical protein